jgi:hypothetical protein
LEEVITYKEAVSGEMGFLVAYDDGTLHAFGGRWKECPRPEKPCPREKEPMPEMYNKENKKCKYCSYSGRIKLDSQEQAIRIAKIIAEIYSTNGGSHARRSVQTLL